MPQTIDQVLQLTVFKLAIYAECLNIARAILEDIGTDDAMDVLADIEQRLARIERVPAQADIYTAARAALSALEEKGRREAVQFNFHRPLASRSYAGFALPVAEYDLYQGLSEALRDAPRTGEGDGADGLEV